MELLDCATTRNGDSGRRGLGDDGPGIKGLRGESLDGDAGVRELVEEGVVEGGWAAEVRQQRRMNIQPPILSLAQDPRRHKQSKRNSNNKVDLLSIWCLRQVPAGECITDVNRKR